MPCTDKGGESRANAFGGGGSSSCGKLSVGNLGQGGTDSLWGMLMLDSLIDLDETDVLVWECVTPLLALLPPSLPSLRSLSPFHSRPNFI